MTKIQYSRMMPAAIKEYLIEHYGFIDNPRCEYFVYSMHDNYRIEQGDATWLLRLYRHEWRRPEEVAFELEYLAFLEQHCDFVAAPIATNSKGYRFVINMPEGQRYAALFHFVPGAAPAGDMTPDTAERLGHHVALIHQYGKDFHTSKYRQVLNLDYLLDQSVAAIHPYLTAHDREFVSQVQDRIKQHMPALPWEWPCLTCCTGDVNNTNFHVHDGGITLFDFDQCGFGQRSFELGKYFASFLSHENKHAIRAAFIKGYESVSPLTEDEHKAVLLYIPAAFIWVMAIQVYNVHLMGSARLDTNYWQRRMQALRIAVEDGGLQGV